MRRWSVTPLGELLSQRLEEFQLTDPSVEGFVTVRLYGKGATRRKIGDGKTPVLRVAYRVRSGDLIYSRIDARNGAFAIIPDELNGFVVSKDFPSFAIKHDRIDTRFLIRFLASEQFFRQLQASSFGTTNRQRIQEASLLSYGIPLPPLAEQERIVKLLDEADGLRKLRAQADRRTADLIPALFHEMFGEVKFAVSPIGDVTSLVTSGATPRGGEEVYTTEGPYFIRSQNVQMNRLDLAGAACLPAGVHHQMARTQVATGDVLLNITGASIGRVAWVGELDRAANVSQHVCLIRPKPDLVDSIYLSALISLPTTQNFILRNQAGASRQALNHKQVRAIEIPLPPLPLQNIFARRVSEIRQIESAQATSRARLDALFQSMLHCAFNGEL